MPKSVAVSIPAPNIEVANVTIKGVTPLIFHKWSDKAIKMIEEKQQKKAKANKKKEARNPEQEYKDSYYYNSDKKIAFPALAIKQALVNSARVLDGVAMTTIRASIFIVGDGDGLIPVDYKTEEKRKDMVKIGMGTADVRYRGQVKGWSMTFPIKFNADVFSLEQVMNLVQTAGFSVGIGEWRPERNGDFGCFEIE